MKPAIKIISMALASALMLGISHSSLATTLQFENIVQPGSIYYQQTTNYTESGFALNLSRIQWVIVSPTYSQATWYGPTANSDFFSTPTPTVVTLSNSQNSTFSLNSIDVGAGVGFNGTFQSGTISFQGLTGNGATFNYDFALTDGAWHTIFLNGNPNFENLQSLSISLSQVSAQGGGLTSLALDNINVSSVPVPATAYLFGSGLIGLAVTARKRKLN